MTNKFTSDVVCGLEVHIELATNTKLFCACPTRGSDEPNTLTCPTCLGLPGAKPVLNKKAVDYAIRLCLALNCEIAPKLIFSRKSYFYPDMSKNYQITQYELPLGEEGDITLPGGVRIGITRVHMEEDPASLIHPNGMANSQFVLVDYNRSGRPLCEVVTEPDLTSAAQARDFMKQLITILQYLKIFSLGDCIIKADANISIKESGYQRVEVKNVTGFKEIERALNYEIERQKQEVKEGKKIIQETRAWDADVGITRSLRTKETEADYGYILDPDLVVTNITHEWIEKIKEDMPELHEQRIKRYLQLGVSQIDAEVITADYNLSEFFEKTIKKAKPDIASKWVRRELVRVLNYNQKELIDIKFGPEEFSQLLILMIDKKITEAVARKILEKLVEEPFDITEYIKKEGLETVNDTGIVDAAVTEVLASNQKAVEELKGGNPKSLNFLMGQVMRRTRGAANPAEIEKLIKEKI